MNIDYTDIMPSVVIAHFLMQFLGRYLEIQTRHPKVFRVLKFSWLWTFMVLLLGELLNFSFFKDYFYELITIVVLYILFLAKELPVARRMMEIAFIPLAAVLFIYDFFHLLTPNFHKNNLYFFDPIRSFAIFWVIGFSFYAQRQGKRERLEKQKEEEERRLLEAKKQELEYQVAERTAELTKQKESLEEALVELKTTQTQLIQSEKMASLGELTAGIAHEIQNPLNFVNNFSEVSVELCQEITEELEKDNFDKNYIIEILTDLSQNQQKITHHGQRAASIVKGMLQHSRTSSGQKELIDINALVDEYLRLSYHGLRAKDKTFNADFKTNLDTNLPKVEVIPQDFGRVLLNIINNAFYAVQQKIKLNIQNYKPTVIIITEKIDNELIIKIQDNGSGMPENVKLKIFQPFFTTKPTGQGTGLGLSMSYDIITKGHGGTIEVESIEGESTTFTIKLPLK